MALPPAQTPLYNHPLPLIEDWLVSLGGNRRQQSPHCWHLAVANWTADIYLETEEITVCYFPEDKSQRVSRSFKYSLSRGDVEAAVLAGP